MKEAVTMSLESAKSFIERMKNDEDFRKKVVECKSSEARKAFALKEGFDFSVHDLKACTGELSEEELNNVSAGVTPIDYGDTNCIFYNGGCM
jgi:predicted ribosomally synthesized peptide with nif11-like leader